MLNIVLIYIFIQISVVISEDGNLFELAVAYVRQRLCSFFFCQQAVDNAKNTCSIVFNLVFKYRFQYNISA